MKVKEFKNQIKEDSRLLYLSPSPERGTAITSLVFNKSDNILALLYDGPGEPMDGKMILFQMQVLDVPDNAIMTMDTPILAKNNRNIIRWLAESRDGQYIAVNDKENEDVENELRARMEHAVSEGISDADVLQEAFDSGFTLEDFAFADDAYAWAQKTKQKYALVELSEKLAKYIPLETVKEKWEDAAIAVEFADGTDALLQENGYTLSDCERFQKSGARFFIDE